MRTDVRVRAPELVGRRWLNTGGHGLSLAELRRRVVLLDFWTFCCVNCLHVLDELRPVEERFPEEPSCSNFGECTPMTTRSTARRGAPNAH